MRLPGIERLGLELIEHRMRTVHVDPRFGGSFVREEVSTSHQRDGRVKQLQRRRSVANRGTGRSPKSPGRHDRSTSGFANLELVHEAPYRAEPST